MAQNAIRSFCLPVLLALLATAADVSPEALRENGHWKQLRKIVEPRAAANPKDAEAAYLLSCVRSAFGDLDAALALAERAVALEPGNSKYHLQLGVVNGEKAGKASFFSAMKLGGRFKGEVQKAIELDGKNPDALWEMMEFYIHAPGIAGGDRRKARAMAGEIMRLNAVRAVISRGQKLQRRTSSRQRPRATIARPRKLVPETIQHK